MTLYDLFDSCCHPHSDILIWDEASKTLFDFDEFIMDCYKKNVPFDVLSKSKVHDICINGDSIQCEVDLL